MVRSIAEDIRKQFSTGNIVTRLVIINVAAFVIINLGFFFLTHLNAGQTHSFYHSFTEYISISSSSWEVLTRPWSLITHMFSHEGFWHILWNMLFIYWFGSIVGDFIGDQHILPLYINGGLAGAIMFFLATNIFPYATGQTYYAMGASAAAMAFVVGAATISPEYNMRLLFLGNVKLKYIAAALVFIDLIGTAGQINTGGHFGHLGGAFLGFIYVVRLRSGQPFGMWVNDALLFVEGIFAISRKPQRNLKVVHRNEDLLESGPLSKEERLDVILEKIKSQGLSKLTDEEKKFLNEMSNSEQ